MKHTKRCRGTETRFTHLPVRDAVDACGCPRVVRMESLRCATCGAWLPLGPSDETPVAVEVRAAELAREDGWQEASADEVYGWNDRLDEVIVEVEGGTWTAVPRDEDDWHAGYLAHAIANHDEEHGL